MRLTRELPLAASLLLAAFAFFAGGGVAPSSVPWLGAGALAALVACAALGAVPRRAFVLLPFGALAAWFGASVAWSNLPDRSWDYANLALLYLLFATLGLLLARRTRVLAVGLAVLLGAVACWALLGKVFAFDYEDLGRVARLSAPVGLWNQLALLGDFALPLALWLAARRRTSGTLLAFVWLVALVLTYSRGGIAVAVVVVLAWLACSGEAADAAWTLVVAGLPAGAVLAVAFVLPGVTADGRPHSTRLHHGLVFGGVLLAGAAGAAALSRLRRPEATPRVRTAALVLGAIVVAGVLAVGALKAGDAWRSFTSSAEVSNGGSHLTSTGSNFRWVWWKQAWNGFQGHELAGTGAGSFAITNLRFRTSYLDVTTEPHDLPLQVLSETGVVGLALLLASFGALFAAAGRRRGHELALALVLPAYALHSLVDIDWDFVAVSAPAFLVAGALAGRPFVPRRPSLPAGLLAAGAALCVFACLLLPWLGRHWSDSAQNALFDGNNAAAISGARRARAADPLLIEPIWTQAAAETSNVASLALYREATRVQPANPETWLFLGEFALNALGCPRLAFPALQRFTDLDTSERPSVGALDKDRALAYVNSGRPDPAHCAPYES